MPYHIKGTRKEVMQQYGGRVIGQEKTSRTEDNSAKCVILKTKFLLYAAKEERRVMWEKDGE